MHRAQGGRSARVSGIGLRLAARASARASDSTPKRLRRPNRAPYRVALPV